MSSSNFSLQVKKKKETKSIILVFIKVFARPWLHYPWNICLKINKSAWRKERPPCHVPDQSRVFLRAFSISLEENGSYYTIRTVHTEDRCCSRARLRRAAPTRGAGETLRNEPQQRAAQRKVLWKMRGDRQVVHQAYCTFHWESRLPQSPSKWDSDGLLKGLWCPPGPCCISLPFLRHERVSFFALKVLCFSYWQYLANQPRAGENPSTHVWASRPLGGHLLPLSALERLATLLSRKSPRGQVPALTAPRVPWGLWTPQRKCRNHVKNLYV